MENVFEVVTFNAFLGVEKLEEVLHELGSHVDLEGANFNRLVDNELEEEFIDALEVGPCGVHFFLLINSGLLEAEVALFDVGEGTEDVLLNHLHHFVQVGNDQRGDVFLVLQHLLEFLDGIESFGL